MQWFGEELFAFVVVFSVSAMLSSFHGPSSRLIGQPMLMMMEKGKPRKVNHGWLPLYCYCIRHHHDFIQISTPRSTQSLRICELRSLVSFLSWLTVNGKLKFGWLFPSVSLLPSGDGTVFIPLTIKLLSASRYPCEMLFYSTRSWLTPLAIPFCFTSWLSGSNLSHPSHRESAIESSLRRTNPHFPT